MADLLSPQTSPPAAKSGRFRRWTIRFFTIAAALYLFIVLIFFFFQTKMIFPGANTQRQDAIIHPRPDAELLKLTDRNGIKIGAVFGKALTADGLPDIHADTRPTILYFYGNGTCAGYSLDVFEDFRRLGMNVIVTDYEGYGTSGGNPSEAGCYAAADAAYDYLLTRKDIDPKKFVAVGWSLGGAVAVDLASRRPVIGVATFSAFTSMDAMARRVTPWLPTSLILRHHFDNLSKLPHLPCPIFLAHGDLDTLVPPEMSDQLKALAKTTVTQYKIEGADHVDLFDVGGEKLLENLREFIDRL